MVRPSVHVIFPVVLGVLVAISWVLLVLVSEQLSDILALTVAIVGGVIMLYGSLAELVHGNLSVDLLASIAVISAVAIHEFLPAAIVVGKKVGITDVFAEVMPEEKAMQITELKKAGYRVAMVGDGINDAPALASADVGIAMGAAGSDIAIETADFTIMTDDLEKVPSAISLSRRMLRIAKQSITIGLSANAIGVALSAAGLINPIMGATIHEIADLFVIFNSARAFAST